MALRKCVERGYHTRERILILREMYSVIYVDVPFFFYKDIHLYGLCNKMRIQVVQLTTRESSDSGVYRS